MEQPELGPFAIGVHQLGAAPVSPNRRRRVRHKIQTPAYISFTAESQGAMLDLHEIVDISEDGVAIQCHSPLEIEKTVNLCLDLADCAEHIYTTGQVIWSTLRDAPVFIFPSSLRKPCPVCGNGFSST